MLINTDELGEVYCVGWGIKLYSLVKLLYTVSESMLDQLSVYLHSISNNKFY